MIIPIHIQKYLQKQEFKNWQIEKVGQQLYNTIIVIPALEEFDGIKKLLPSLAKNSQEHLKETLILVVVNNIIGVGKEKLDNNYNLLLYLRDELKNNSILNIGLIDASSAGKEMPKKNGGVGFARKLGADLALSNFDYSSIQKKIIISLDADCTVEENYLETIVTEYNNYDLNAAVIKFEHPLDAEEKEKSAIINYEIFLRYYILGLKYAKSPYAYFSVGSVISCDAEGYVKVGGMNKKKAGEDFYFLEKLAKLYKIKHIDSTIVYPASRPSDRVPFGTGARIKRFIDNVQDEYTLYSPSLFLILKDWLQLFSSITLSSNIPNILESAKNTNSVLYDFLIQQKFELDWNNIIQNSKTEIQLNKQKLNWMDSFRTLKLIHYLRDFDTPNDNMFVSLNKLFEIMEITIDFKSEQNLPPLKIQQKYLEILRKLT